MKSRAAAPQVSYSLSRYKASANLLAAMSLIAISAPSAFATNYYWDTNNAAGFTNIAGAWNGSNNFWNTDITGATSGTFIASPTSGDDLFVNGGATGTITMTGTQSASSFSFGTNVATTLSGGTSLTIGGTGSQSGVFASSTAASNLSTPLTFNSSRTAFNFSNTSTGLLTIGEVTGAAASGTQTVTVASSSTGGITLNRAISNGGSGGNVAITVNNTGTGITTLAPSFTKTSSGTTSTSTTVTMADTSGLFIGMGISGTGIPAGSFITAITPNTSVTISAAATATGSITATTFGNVYSGGTTISGGTVVANVNSISSGGIIRSGAFGTGPLTLNNGVTLNGASGTRTTIAASTINIAGNITVAANTGSVELAGTVDLGGASRTMTLGRASANYGSGSEVLRFNQITGGGNATVQNGSLVLATATGTALTPSIARNQTAVSFAGNLALELQDGVAWSSGGGSLFGTGTNAPSLTLNAPVSRGGGILQMGDGISGGASVMRNAEVFSLSGGGSVSASNTTGNVTTGTLTINNGNGATFSGNITETGGVGRIALTKTGAGTQTLSGTNTYTGATTLTGGTLIFATTSAKSSGTTVNAGAGTVVGLGVGGAGFSSTDLDGLINNTLTGFILNATARAGVDTSAGDFTHATNQAGSRGLVKLGANSLTLSGDNSFTGNTTISAGTIKVGSVNALGANSSSVTVNTGAVLDLNGTTMTATNALALNGTGSGSGGSLVNSSSTAGTYAGVVTISPGTSIGGTGNFTLSGGIAATTSTNNLVKSGSGTVTLSAAASGSNRSASATTQVDGGVLRIQNASALATSGSSVTTINGGTLELNGGITLDQPITANNGATLRSDGTNASNGKITVSTAVGANSVTLATVNSGDVFTVGNGANDISGGNGSDDTITVSGPGTVVLASASDYVGNWSFNAGTTQLGSGSALGATPASTITLNGGALNGRLASSTVFTANPITVIANSALNADRSSNGAGVTYTFGTLSIGSQTLSTTSTAAVTSGTGSVIVGATTLTGNATFNVTNGASAATNLTLGGIVSGGSFGITKTGNGTLTLSGANTFNGGVTVNAGTLAFGGSSTNTGSTVNDGPTGTGNLTFNNTATLSSTATGNTLLVPTVSLNGTLNTGGTQRIKLGWSNLELNGGTRTINLNSNGKTVTGGNTLAAEGTGQWSLETQNLLANPGTIQNGVLDLQTTAYSGGTYGLMFLTAMTYSSANINVGPNVILGLNGNQGTSGTNAAALTVQSGGILNLLNASRNVGSLSGGGNVFNSMISTGTGNVTLSVISNSGTADFSGALSNGPAGTLAFTKSGASTQVLSGTNTYSGNTTVSGGTLELSGTGSINNSANIIVNGGVFKNNSSVNLTAPLTFTSGTVGGTNLTGVALSVGTGAVISPGNSPGTMSAGATTFANGGTYLFEINNAGGTAGTNWDLLNATSLDITATGGGFTVSLASLVNPSNAAGNADGFVPDVSKAFLFVDTGAAITSFSATAFTVITPLFTNTVTGTWAIARGDTVTGGDNTELYVTYTVIPEPSTYAALAGLGAIGLALYRRRRAVKRAA